MNECKGIFGRLFGHKFEPAYNRFPPAFSSFSLNGSSPEEFCQIADTLTRKEVAGVWCIRCGVKQP